MLTLSRTLIGKEINKIGLIADVLVLVFFRSHIDVFERKSEPLVRASRLVGFRLSVKEIWLRLSRRRYCFVLLLLLRLVKPFHRDHAWSLVGSTFDVGLMRQV